MGLVTSRGAHRAKRWIATALKSTIDEWERLDEKAKMLREALHEGSSSESRIPTMSLPAETATLAGPGIAVSLGVMSPGTTLGPTWVGARATLDWFVAELASDDVGVRYAAPIRTS